MLGETASWLVLLVLYYGDLSYRGSAVTGLQLRQTFYHDSSNDDYLSSVGSSTDDEGYGGQSPYAAGDYDEDNAGYDDGGGSRKKGGYASSSAGRGHDEDAYEGQKVDSDVYEARSNRDRYEPVYERKPRPSRGHAYNDEYDGDDDKYGRNRGYNKKPKKKKIKPKVIIVKKIIPLSTTTAVQG